MPIFIVVVVEQTIEGPMLYFTLFYMLFIGASASAAEAAKWTIHAAPPAAPPTTEGPKVNKPYELGPKPVYSELTGAHVMSRKSESEIAEAFGYSPNDNYKSKKTPAGVVSTVSLAYLLSLAFPEAKLEKESPLASYSLCKGKELIFMQSILTRGSDFEIYGIRRTCSDECFVTVEVRKKDKVTDTTNEYQIASVLCAKVMGE